MIFKKYSIVRLDFLDSKVNKNAEKGYLYMSFDTVEQGTGFHVSYSYKLNHTIFHTTRIHSRPIPYFRVACDENSKTQPYFHRSM